MGQGVSVDVEMHNTVRVHFINKRGQVQTEEFELHYDAQNKTVQDLLAEMIKQPAVQKAMARFYPKHQMSLEMLASIPIIHNGESATLGDLYEQGVDTLLSKEGDACEFQLTGAKHRC